LHAELRHLLDVAERHDLETEDVVERFTELALTWPEELADEPMHASAAAILGDASCPATYRVERLEKWLRWGRGAGHG